MRPPPPRSIASLQLPPGDQMRKGGGHTHICTRTVLVRRKGKEVNFSRRKEGKEGQSERILEVLIKAYLRYSDFVLGGSKSILREQIVTRSISYF